MGRALLLASLLTLLSSGCARPDPPPVEQLAAGSDAAARRVVISFYTAYVAGDVDAALTHLCERGSAQQARARELIGRSQAVESPYRVERFEVGAATPLWADQDPYYEVAVRFPKTDGSANLDHQHRVRAREGCIERFLPEASTPALPPAELPEPPDLEAPVGEGDEVVEL